MTAFLIIATVRGFLLNFGVYYATRAALGLTEFRWSPAIGCAPEAYLQRATLVRQKLLVRRKLVMSTVLRAYWPTQVNKHSKTLIAGLGWVSPRRSPQYPLPLGPGFQSSTEAGFIVCRRAGSSRCS